MKLWVELSGENDLLAAAELQGILAACGVATAASETPLPGWREADVPTLDLAVVVADRLALGHRVLRIIVPPGPPSVVAAAVAGMPAGERGATARFDWIGRRPSGAEELRDLVVGAYRAAGSRIRLRRPDREFLLWADDRGVALLGLVADVDRTAVTGRRMPTLPFQRPVSLPPRLARAAVNLSRVRPGELVVDPFVGTGAMLLEASLLGTRVAGVDRDPRMIQGALRNFAAFGRTPERLTVEDGEAAAAQFADGSVDAIVTDPPYGRASSTRGESAGALAGRVLAAWSRTLRTGGRVVVVLPAGSADPLPPTWIREWNIPHRVHRSLTREFRVFRREPDQ